MSQAPSFHIDQVEKISGFAVANARPNESISVVYRASLTSDDEMFYKLMDGLPATILKVPGLMINSIYHFLVLLHNDGSADVYINEFPVIVEMIAKRDMVRGQLVGHGDIADIRRVKFEGIEIRETDNIVYCFKEGWKFGLYFDFERSHRPKSKLHLDQLSLSLGSLYRHLAFEHVYKTLETREQFERMQEDGWFPFIELMGNEFKTLSEIYESRFDVESRIKQLVDRFDQKRITTLASKWWSNPLFRQKQPILEAGITAYLQSDQAGNIMCLKTLLPEIEGLIRLNAFSDTGRDRRRVKEITGHLTDKAKDKTQDDTSLFLPSHFVEYLRIVIFRDFDLSSDDIALSRHSSGHGVATPGAYTRAKALQAILTLDQIYFYL